MYTKYMETPVMERIGFDFYCDVANNIVKARARKNWTQKELAEKSGIKGTRLSNIETLKTRIDLDDLEKLSKVLDVTVNWLINEEDDSPLGDCLYLVWMESVPDFKLYIKASNKRMAFLHWDRMLKRHMAAYGPRERFYAELVGVPVSKKEIQDKFPKRVTEDLPLEPDEPEQ